MSLATLAQPKGNSKHDDSCRGSLLGNVTRNCWPSRAAAADTAADDDDGGLQRLQQILPRISYALFKVFT